jgi:hypothetical protein
MGLLSRLGDMASGMGNRFGVTGGTMFHGMPSAGIERSLQSLAPPTGPMMPGPSGQELVMQIAKQLKARFPEAPDQAILQEAQKMAADQDVQMRMRGMNNGRMPGGDLPPAGMPSGGGM